MKTVCLVVALMFCKTLNAQLLDLSTMYRSHWQLINPAAIDRLHLMDEYKNNVIHLSARHQWLGKDIPQAPWYGAVRFESYPVNRFSNTQLKYGIFSTTGQAGAVGTTRLQGNVAAILALDPRARSVLSVGFNVGWLGNYIHSEMLQFASGSNYLTEDLLRQHYLDVSVGVFYRQSFREYCMICNDDLFVEEFYVGLSVPQATGDLVALNKKEETAFIAPQRNISLLAGIVFPIFKGAYNRRSFIEPSVWIRNVPGSHFKTLFDGKKDNKDKSLPISTDVNVRVVYNQTLWGGIGFSTQKIMHTEFGVYLKDPNTGHGNNRGIFLSNLGFSYSFPVAWDSPFINFLELNVGFAWD